MTVVCDFNVIIGNDPVTIGDGGEFQTRFGTGGREPAAPCFFIMNVSGLTHTREEVAVRVNGVQVGALSNYRPAGAGIDGSDIDQPEKWRQSTHWYTQMIGFDGSSVNERDPNNLSIDRVGFPESSPTNRYDDFQIKNLLVFFHQDV